MCRGADRLRTAGFSCASGSIAYIDVLRFNSWADRPVNPSLGRCKFSFVLIADTHVDRENLPSSSPFAVNQHANGRTRYCVEDIKLLQHEMGQLAPKFVLHLGDLTHPIPSMPAYAKAVADFQNIFAELGLPLYLLPGNHDVGDKPVDWAPAGVVCEKFLSLWESHFGPQYQSFSIHGVKFVLINSQIINSGLALERTQQQWLEQTLDDTADERIMLFLHYPPYLCKPDEPENYDNLAEPGRSWILNLAQNHRAEAMFTGHVHHFWYNRRDSMDCYLLPSTSFTRQDYSEMFRAVPDEQMHDGRNDTAKVGYFIVLVYENGHVCHFRNTRGKALERGEHVKTAQYPKGVIALHPREVAHCPVGFDMRHPWNEQVEIAPSGALDEFRRKSVRNDYPLFALWQMGVGRMRIPVEDLLNESTVARMRALRESGHEFVVVGQGIPSEDICSNLITNQDLIKRFDVTLPVSKLEHAAATLRNLKSAVNFPLYLSKLRMKSDIVRSGEPYFHQISHGFTLADENEVEMLLNDLGSSTLFDGLVFRLARTDNVSPSLISIAATCARLNIAGSVTMFMADQNPARHRLNDQDNANRIAEGIFATAAYDNLDLFVDTFMDLDRGHSVRSGVIDRFCNPRHSMFVVQNLCAILASITEFSGKWAGGVSEERDAVWVSLEHHRYGYYLTLPESRTDRFHAIQTAGFTNTCRIGVAVDLVSGASSPLTVSLSNEGIRFELENPLSGPILIVSHPDIGIASS